MPVINVLSPHLADLIAAGEVVERPASVIKELVENSFDAGARNVTVEIRNGGTAYIRVTDDGCGMSPEDAGIAFLRHATSKLHSEAELNSIETMGFRGEALAAISSVCHMEIITRPHGAPEGTRVVLDAGDITDMTAFGCPEGTTMICRDLFFNTPARLKFLKSDRSETSLCSAAALKCAMARPDVAVRFIKDGEEEFFTPGDGKTESCLYALLGRDEAAAMLPCTSSSPGGLSISGYISSPAHCRGNRSRQYFFVNGRCIRSVSIQTALEQAYKNSLLAGRYPSCALFLSVDPETVDVNVHPQKTEVRFGSEKAIFDLVYHAVRMSLESEDTVAAKSASVRYTASGSSNAKTGFYKTMTIDEYRSAAEKADKSSGTVSGKFPAVSPAKQTAVREDFPPEKSFAAKASVSPAQKSPVPQKAEALSSSGNTNSFPEKDPEEDVFFRARSSFSEQTRIDLPASPAGGCKAEAVQEEKITPEDNAPAEDAPVSSAVVSPACTAEEPSAGKPMTPAPFRILGEAFKTYILLEQDNELILIDKHAAHERMIFDRLKAQDREIPSQYLLVPVTAKFTPEDAEVLTKNSELLSRLGFEIDAYGELDFIIRSVPADMAASDVIPAVEEICEKLKNQNTPDPSAVRDEILHTVACKAAIKAGWDTSREEMETIARKVLSGEIRYCPHGRPVSSSVTRAGLDKLFKRIV